MSIAPIKYETLLACCGSKTWAKRMNECGPVADAASLHEISESIWWSLLADDWLEAFAAHPRIGESSSKKWSAQEQAGMTSASEETADAITRLNAAYCDRFGYIFIVCATGKSAGEMRHLLEQRMTNAPEQELRVAAAEQAKITRLRLDKVLAG